MIFPMRPKYSNVGQLKPARFRERWPWYGGDAQSVAFNYLKLGLDLDEFAGEHIEVALSDGTDDRLVHHLDLPAATASDSAGTVFRKPLIIILHGLGGHGEEGYVKLAARHLLDKGYPVVRYNNRGCGLGREQASESHWPGDTIALQSTIDYLQREYADVVAAGVGILAYSLGSSLLVHWLAEKGVDTGPVFAGVTISAPIDLEAASRHLSQPRTLPYRKYILWKMQDELLRESMVRNAAETEAIKQASSVWELDDHFNAPRKGFAGAKDFYDASHMAPMLPRLGIPLMMEISHNDPFIPYKTYKRYDFTRAPEVGLVTTRGGGHCGFHAPESAAPWCVRMADDFFAEHAQ